MVENYLSLRLNHHESLENISSQMAFDYKYSIWLREYIQEYNLETIASRIEYSKAGGSAIYLTWLPRVVQSMPFPSQWKGGRVQSKWLYPSASDLEITHFHLYSIGLNLVITLSPDAKWRGKKCSLWCKATLPAKTWGRGSFSKRRKEEWNLGNN